MYNKDNTNTSLDEILRQSKLNKIITNPEKLPNNLQNYVSVSKTWNIEKKEFIHYYYMNNVNDKELQLTPLKTLKQYDGTSDSKGIPPPEMHDDMIKSTKPIEIELLESNDDYIGYLEQKHIMLHNWPHSRKPKLDPKTKTMKYDFGHDCYNKHATGAKKQGFGNYKILASDIQLEKLQQAIIDHENPNTPSVFTESKKNYEWYNNIFGNKDLPYPIGRYIQGRTQIASSTSHVNGLIEDMKQNPDPEHWRINGFQYHIIKDGKEIVIGGNSRGRSFIRSPMRNKGMYIIEITEEYTDVLTQEALEEFSSWLNKRTTKRQEFTDIPTLETHLYNKILIANLLTKKTLVGGGVPKHEHPSLRNFFKGYENTVSKDQIKSIKASVTTRFLNTRQDEIQKDEGSIDCSVQGLKVLVNKKVWSDKTKNAIKTLEKKLKKPLKESHNINSVHGMIGKSVVNYLCALDANILRMDKLKTLTDKESIEEKEKLQKKMGKVTKIPYDLVVFVTFSIGAKYDKFFNGGGSGHPDKLKAIVDRAGRMIDGTLSIIPIDPRIKNTDGDS